MPVLERSPLAASQWLVALDSLVGPSQEVVLIGAGDEANVDNVLETLRSQYAPHRVVLFRGPTNATRSEHLDASFAARAAQADELTAYVCQGSTCGPPLKGAEVILQSVGC